MKKETLDCRGLTCPQPVVETKKKLADIPVGTLTVLVDNETAKNNLLKLAGSMDLEAMARQDDGVYAVSLLKSEITGVAKTNAPAKTLLLTKDTFGSGSEELGALLMKSFLYALAESEKLPETVFLVNGGVRLACDGSPVLDSLAKLTELGVEVLSCGLCLDFFELKDNLRVGSVTNMYAIVEQLMSSDPLILS
ncbi:sulfurtransferase-like selenium metabolism protein YedF [Dethiobacter alkaliphilus]|uniref:sulfurtransferase-like selenium metabolism protein YedF n=1 Tax=Dethiobacter alkaliphilus TaxID=427926 RepID=UPI0022264979|nr:sulfurtransferase-like selenium metabolism protein YedF [Dethiobacter alkaliphilus]MCW3490803.1 sulfurtransferase-like selenium metabolism protein YedF [Dethiobacter alkaliphilus]